MGDSRTDDDYQALFDFQIRCLLLGDSGVGKTSLLLRYSGDKFPTSHLSTIGVDFKVKTCLVDSTRVKLQVWDTVGQERFRSIATSFIRGSHAILLVYDVTNRESFEHVTDWLQQIAQFDDVNMVRLLVANKCDAAPGMIHVSESEGHALANEHNMAFFLTSAKSNIGVEEAFEQGAAREVVQRIQAIARTSTAEKESTTESSALASVQKGVVSFAGRKWTFTSPSVHLKNDTAPSSAPGRCC